MDEARTDRLIARAREARARFLRLKADALHGIDRSRIAREKARKRPDAKRQEGSSDHGDA
jgi:hypothetical protein